MQATISCESVPGHPAFRRLSSVAGIHVELRYATANNFVGRDLYSPLDCAWLHRDAAAALECARDWLQQRHPELTFLILDAMRPQRVQEQLWAALQGTDLLQYLANPVRGSIHSFGMAVDITLARHDGTELDMGTPFDDLTELSHPALEEGFLAKGDLTVAQVANRGLLREAMLAAGYHGINTEWWHFDCGDRLKVRAEYARIL
jgi:D-alanyl-D-alanine dipeptidase